MTNHLPLRLAHQVWEEAGKDWLGRDWGVTKWVNGGPETRLWVLQVYKLWLSEVVDRIVCVLQIFL